MLITLPQIEGFDKMENNKERIVERFYRSVCDDKQKKLHPFYYESIDKCKQCGKTSPLDHDRYCFWCWEEIQEGLEMLKESP